MNSDSRQSTGPLAIVDGWLRLCRADALAEAGEAIGFELVPVPGARLRPRGFAIRFDGIARAYVNRCAHVPVALDWIPGQVFDPDGQSLLCSVHGAEYDPATGRCRAGPCSGRGHLEPLVAAERDGWVWIRVQTGAPTDLPPATLEFRDDE